MYKAIVLFCVVFCVVIEARPKWQFLPPKAGYVPVYIRAGDTPLEEINPDLAEAFHALPSGRSAGKLLAASPEVPEQPRPESDEKTEEIPPESTVQADQPQPDSPQEANMNQPDTPKASEDSPPPESEKPEDLAVDRRPYEKKFLEKKTKKATEIVKPIERR